jgi:hypothetical protein
MKHKLTLHAVMWTHTGVVDESNPVMRYEVRDERGQKVAFITNTRASGRPASWQISRVKDGGRIGESVGDRAAAEDALSALQKELDAR